MHPNATGKLGNGVRKWTLEGALGLAWFSDNDDVLETNKLEQDPFGLVRGTLLYHLTPTVWAGTGFLYTIGNCDGGHQRPCRIGLSELHGGVHPHGLSLTK